MNDVPTHNSSRPQQLLTAAFAALMLGPLLPTFLAPSWLLPAGLLEASAEPFTYTIDRAHSTVGFEVRHFFNQVPGRFTRFDGRVVYDAEHPEKSSVHLVVEVDSINTDLETRDQHLRSEDFFATEQYPQMSFRSTAVSKTGAGALQVTGDLTLRGKTKRLTIPVKILGIMVFSPEVAKAGFEAEFVIDRKEFGVSWNRALDQGGTVLGDEVTIRITLQLDRAPSGNVPSSSEISEPADDETSDG